MRRIGIESSVRITLLNICAFQRRKEEVSLLCSATGREAFDAAKEIDG
jgi:hypothetical protein